MTSRQTEPLLPRGLVGRTGQGWGEVHFVNVGMEDTVYEANGGGFVGILIWQLDMDFPHSSIERSFPSVLILPKKQQTAKRDSSNSRRYSHAAHETEQKTLA